MGNSSESSRSPQQIKANKRRAREIDWDETRRPAWVAWLGLLCAIVLIVAMAVMSQSTRTSKPMNINGDQLGPFYMSNQAYAAHSSELMGQLEGNEPRWALVSPAKALSSKELAAALKVEQPEKLRVGTLLIGPAKQLMVPEPAAGLRRVDVFDLAARQITDKPVKFSGALVYAAPEELRQIQKKQSIMAVEPAPVDAVYGRMGIRAVNAEG